MYACGCYVVSLILCMRHVGAQLHHRNTELNVVDTVRMCMHTFVKGVHVCFIVVLVDTFTSHVIVYVVASFSFRSSVTGLSTHLHGFDCVPVLGAWTVDMTGVTVTVTCILS